MRSVFRHIRPALLLAGWLPLCVGTVGAQERPPTTPSVVRTPAPEDSAGVAEESRPTPGGAFLRSLIVPGWGQAAYDAYLRGGIFFSAQAGSWFMLIKTLAKLDEARQIEAHRVAAVHDSILAAAAEDAELARKYEEHPDSLAIDLAFATDSSQAVQGIRDLIDARKEQREDWITWTIFWTLASGVDAYVNAHLSDFPAKVSAEPRPGGGISVGVRVPAPGGP
ncbi:MAG TPA: DUF5683 domain-containing protein [Longimicrobiales bacterium]